MGIRLELGPTLLLLLLLPLIFVVDKFTFMLVMFDADDEDEARVELLAEFDATPPPPKLGRPGIPGIFKLNKAAILESKLLDESGN